MKKNEIKEKDEKLITKTPSKTKDVKETDASQVVKNTKVDSVQENKVKVKKDDSLVSEKEGGNGGTTKVKKPWTKTQKILLTTGLVSVPTLLLIGGIITFMFGYSWYRPVTPLKKIAEAKAAHLNFEGNMLYSYDKDIEYDIQVIYNHKDNKNQGGIKARVDKAHAFKLQIPLSVNKVEIKVNETKGGSTSYDHTYQSRSDSPVIWTDVGGSVTNSSIHTADPNKDEDKDYFVPMAYNNKGELIKGDKRILASFSNKTIMEVAKEALEGNFDPSTYTIDKKAGIPDGAYDDYGTYAEKSMKVIGSLHYLYWTATALTHFKGLDKDTRNIEPHVLREGVKITFKNGDIAFIVKSDNGNDPTLGVKYGSLLTTNGHSFAGKPIDGKDWVKDLGFTSDPAGDSYGIYTVIVKDSNTNKDLLSTLKSKIGGLN